jgi:hypothetical protein
MNDLSGHSNPFSTKFWTPGALPFEFDDETITPQTFVQRFFSLAKRSRMAQIVGPHGSGKTTLLAALEQVFMSLHIPVIQATLHEGERKLPANFKVDGNNRNTVFFLDGYEQLSFFSQLKLRFQPWHRTSGLLLTTHTPARGIPVLYEMAPSFVRLQKIVHSLTRGTSFTVDDQRLQDVFVRHHGNFRNVFFELYDEWTDCHDDCQV